MNTIDLDRKRIYFQGENLSADDLTAMIQDKMDKGDMKISDLAKALEELNTALENSSTIDQTLVVSKEDYEKLQHLGKGKAEDAAKQAVMAYLRQTIPREAGNLDPALATIKCPSCKKKIQVPSATRPIVVECPECGTSCRLAI